MDPAFQRRALIVCLVLVAGLSALSVRLISLQVWDREISATTVVPRFKLKERIPASCGHIVDRNNTRLTQNRPEGALVADLNHLHAIDILLPAVAHRQASREEGWKSLKEEDRKDRLFQIRRVLRRTLSPQEIIEAHLSYAAEVIGPKIRMSSDEFRDQVQAGIDLLLPEVARHQASREEGWESLNEEEREDRLFQIRRLLRRTRTPEEIIEAHLSCAAEASGPESRTPTEHYWEEVKAGPKRVIVCKSLREDLVRDLEEALQARFIQGFSFERSQRRFYPMPTLAPHVVGIQDYQGNGQSGIEKSMQHILAGRDGQRVLKRDENGLVNLTEPAHVTPPKMGKHVRLTLDMGIQAIVEEELGMAFESFGAKHGSIIVVDPHTGDILAMASRPHFNLNLRENFQNAGTSFAVSAQYESGSVMKIVPMAAALDRGGVTRETVVDCGWGGIVRYGFRIPDHHAYGELTFDKVLAKSSNPGAFQFAETVGREGFYEVLHDFGFGQRTGFPIPGEARGRIQDPTNIRNYASATYGYGVSVTPLQLAMAYSVLANGGKLLKPRLIDSIIANNGAILDRTPVRQVRQVIRPETARKMSLALEKVVLEGTGTKAKVPGYRVGGKTGTAEKWDPIEKKYDPEKKFATFAGILPVHDPKFVCVVTIDEPSLAKFDDDFNIGGGTIGAPVFSAVAGRIAPLMNIPQTEEIVEEAVEETIAQTENE